jgi:phosphomannomutase
MQTRPNPSIFKSYDIRGIYPSELDESAAELVGRAFVEFVGCSTVAVGRDMRESSEPLFQAFARGVTSGGADVVDLGLTSTDELYFAVGHFGYPAGAMITASHNPKEYNGFKLCREKAIALSAETGVYAIRDIAASGRFSTPARTGTVRRRDVLDDFAQHCLSFVDRGAIRPLKVAIDCGNGMGGLIVPAIFKHLPIEVVPLYFELDGAFPNHPASPIEAENMADVQRAVREHGADLGAAFDGDADRVFITD